LSSDKKSAGDGRAAHQRQAMGAALIQKTREQMGSLHASAPARAESVAYYPKMGFARHESAWILRADESLTISRR
jgi:predicted N-acetyltransferase YhbS